MATSRVELFEQIRRDRRCEGLSIRELAERHGVHRRTVRQALASPQPPPRKEYPRRPRPAIGPYVTGGAVPYASCAFCRVARPLRRTGVLRCCHQPIFSAVCGHQQRRTAERVNG